MPQTASELADEIEANPDLDKLPDLRAIILATPGCRRLYFAGALRCLDARRFYFDKNSKEMVYEPDGTAIMKAVAWLSAYDAGLPMQTTVNLNVDSSKAPSLVEAATQSPALVQSLKRALAEIERKMPRSRKGAEQPAELVEPEKDGPAGGF